MKTLAGTRVILWDSSFADGRGAITEEERKAIWGQQLQEHTICEQMQTIYTAIQACKVLQ